MILTIAYRGLARLALLFIFLTSSGCFKEETAKTTSGGSASVSSNLPTKWNISTVGAGLNLGIDQDILNSFAAGDLDGNGHNPIEQMFKQWNNSTSSMNFFVVPASAVTHSDTGNLETYKNDGIFGIYRSDVWLSGVSSQALAVTQWIGYKRNAGTSSEYIELSHADIILNYRNYSFSTDSSSDSTYDLASVIIHELGHFLGLNHNNSFSSVMYPYLGITDSQRTLSSADGSNVRSLYGLSALSSGSSPIIASSMSSGGKRVFKLPTGARESESGEVTGLIELRADGKCHHYENGKLVHVH